ncbi:MAG: type IV pili methyl-accepting chemotaxis transducer N-terminal domain-containing protein [Pseudomonadota bacterium]
MFALTAQGAADTQQSQDGSIAPDDIGESERVDYSGKLRMLSQRVVAAGCNYAADIDAERSGEVMRAARAEFELILDALEFGNPDLGIIGEERHRKLVNRIAIMRELWMPILTGLDAIEPGGDTPETVARLAQDSADLLEMARQLVVEMAGQYSQAVGFKQSHVLLVDVSGRQRMLTQRMSKNICLVSSGLNVETATAELEQTSKVFEASLFALYEGLPSSGIVPPPNETIADSLEVVMADWAELKPHVTAVLAGEALTGAVRSEVFHGMNRMTGNMNTAVGHYTEAAKR